MKVSLFKPTGNSAAQKTYVIEHDNKLWLQAYDEIICRYEKDTKKIEVSTHWTQSKSTRCYLIAFLNQYGIFPCKGERDLLNAQIDETIKIVKEINN